MLDGEMSARREAERLAALRRYEVLDTPDEEAFDRVVHLARAMFGTPIAEVSLIDAERQWLKARVPDGPREAPRGWSFCAYAIQGDGVMVVSDALADERVRTSPFVTGRPHIRFYAGAPLRTPDGYNLGTLCVVSPEPRTGFDAVEREKLQALADIVVSELELRRRRREDARMLNRVLENSADCIKILGLDGELQSMNEAGRVLMEVDDLRACLGRLWPGFWTGEARAALLVALDEARAGRTGRFEGRAATLKGTPKWWDVTVSPILAEDGKPERLLAVSRDVTDRKHAEARLRELVGTLDLAAIFVRGLDGAIRFWSKGCERLYGWTAEEAVGRSGHDLLRTGFPTSLAEVEATLLRDGEWRGDLRHVRRDGTELIAAAHKVLRRDEQGRAVAVMESVADVTALRRTRAELERLNATLEARVAERTAELRQTLDRLHAEMLEREAVEEALRHAQKMEAVGQLTGGIAHDFNNLMTVVRGSLELMQRRVDQGRTTELDRYLEPARQAVQRAADLTGRLLSFARRQRLDPKPLVLDELVAGMAELVRRTVGSKIAVELDLRDGAWRALCDANGLENALLNLAINARDALPGGGTLTLATAEVRLSAADVAGQDGAGPGDYVEVTVSDTGVGMAPEVMARAFEPFFTTKPIGQGTGLGLPQVYGFVRQSGGVVKLESVPGQGTTVRLYLPRHEPAREPGR